MQRMSSSRYVYGLLAAWLSLDKTRVVRASTPQYWFGTPQYWFGTPGIAMALFLFLSLLRCSKHSINAADWREQLQFAIAVLWKPRATDHFGCAKNLARLVLTLDWTS